MGFMNSTFPLAVYGLQDAFSGYILYLKLWTRNSDPKLIGRWYMDHLYSTKGNLSCFNNICIQIVIQLKRALNAYIIETGQITSTSSIDRRGDNVEKCENWLL